MSEKILFVDDDPNLLASCERAYHRRFHLETALGGEAGLAMIAERGPYAVVVSDRQMPRMDGIQFLAAVKQKAPDTVRMMLSGNVDLEAAVRTVNEGSIYRILIKPCPPEILGKALEDACTLYRLVTGEKELLNKTLSGSVKLLVEILSAVDTKAFGRTEKMRNMVNQVIMKVHMENAWEIHLAAMLASIGYLTLPPETVIKARSGEMLSKVEERLLEGMPETAAKLLANIPRLQGVAGIVRYQGKHFDGGGFPADTVSGEAIPAGARLLKIFFDLMDLQSENMPALKALNEMQQRRGWYDPKLLAAVRTCFGGTTTKPEPDTSRPNISITAGDLTVGMVLYSDLSTKDGTIVLSAGHQISQMSLEKIRNFEQLSGIKEPIFVEIAS